mmetsp:Transcript_2601/g.7376  ORF Transcript_2601/g.7376 Transcript_2601/m.7376 type:complete len:384 (-) Transcript_2601:278-1429(-)
MEEASLRGVVHRQALMELGQKHRLAVELCELKVHIGLLGGLGRGTVRLLLLPSLGQHLGNVRLHAVHGCHLLLKVLEVILAQILEGVAHCVVTKRPLASHGPGVGPRHDALDIRLAPRERGEPKLVADGVALVGPEEQCHPTGTKVAVAVALPVTGMDLRVSVQISNTLNVNQDLLATCVLVSPMAEGLRSVALLLILHKPRVAVVLDVLAFDETLHAVQALHGTSQQLVELRSDEIHLLWGVTAVVELPEKFGIHLQLHVLIIHLCASGRVLVALGNEVQGALPVAVSCVGRQLLHRIALTHSAGPKGCVIHLHHHILVRIPLIDTRVPSPPYGTQQRLLVHPAGNPEVGVLHKHLVGLLPTALKALERAFPLTLNSKLWDS